MKRLRHESVITPEELAAATEPIEYYEVVFYEQSKPAVSWYRRLRGEAEECYLAVLPQATARRGRVRMVHHDAEGEQNVVARYERHSEQPR